MDHTLAVLAAALVIEAAIGYPDALFARIRHPVVWVGWLIDRLDRRLNRENSHASMRRAAGVLAVLALVVASGGAAWAAAAILRPLPFGWLVEGLLAATLLAQRSLHDHVFDVTHALTVGGLEAGRAAVSRIVGRNPATLDEHGVARAGIESLAENFSDGVVAPAFWLALFGLPGIAVYKAVNTADSMIGHRTPRHEAFGWAAARLDDVLNLIPARLSALLVAAGAWMTAGASPAAALRSAMRDGWRHRSPNAGWPEAAMAGALDLRLGGPRIYGAERVMDAWLGPGRTAATPADMERALAVYRRACAILIAAAVAASVIS